jgi:two-component system, OmpR family, KDP operon response regulator KdpE
MSCPRIYIVNDYAPLQNLLRINLKVRGFEVIATTSCPDTLASIQKEQPDLVITDLILSSIDGFDLCRQVCQTSDSALIVINLRSGESDLLKCLEMGVDDYISKPFGVDELLARIGAALRHRRKVRMPEMV